MSYSYCLVVISCITIETAPLVTCMILRLRPQESVHFETAYMFSWIVEEEALNHFGERFQKDVISVRQFTGFVWTIGGSICVLKICGRCLNPLSPNTDQHQFSPNDIHTMSRD